jgi:hypothetical protein
LFASEAKGSHRIKTYGIMATVRKVILLAGETIPARLCCQHFCGGREVVQFKCGTRILRVSHGRDARAMLDYCSSAKSFLWKVICQFHSQVCPLSGENA